MKLGLVVADGVLHFDGTTDFAGHSDERAFEPLGSDQHMPTRLFCVLQWMPLRQCGDVVMTKRDTHACLPAHCLPTYYDTLRF